MSTEKPIILDPLSGVQSGRPGTTSFVLGLPDPATFPTAVLQESARRVLHKNGAVALQYAPEQGYGRLIDCLIEKWERDEDAKIGRENVTLAYGSTDAVSMVSSLLARPGDVILVEAPSYRDTLHLFRDQGLTLVQIPVDEHGLRTDAMEQTLQKLSREEVRPRFLYTIPTFQNPSGATLSLSRRIEVLGFAEDYDFPILADDVYRDLFYDEGVPPALGALDSTGERVITVGSFSKVLAAGLRLGWVIASPEIISALYNGGERAMGGGANPFVSHIVADFCEDGRLDQHISSLRETYQRRRDAMLSALESHMPEAVSWNEPAGGYFIWLNLTHGLSASEVVRTADERGVTCLAGPAFFADGAGDEHIRLAFSYVSPDQIDTGIALLAQVIRGLTR